MHGIEIHLAPNILGHLGAFPITNTLLLTLAASAFLITVTFAFFRKKSFVPTRFQALLEIIVEGALALIDDITRDRKKTLRFLPIVLTIFLLVLTANWVELIPGTDAIFLNTHEGAVPLLRSPSSDLNLTLALALISVFSAQFISIAAHGITRHVRKYVSLNPLHLFVGILEAISEAARIISFSFRLFGNIFAGGVLLITIGAFLPFVAPLPFLGVELFVGLIQALVFSGLTLIFMTMAGEVTSH